ncbi:hypothetical protein ULO1_21690, partial [Carboxydocella sp. ULO1]
MHCSLKTAQSKVTLNDAKHLRVLRGTAF